MDSTSTPDDSPKSKPRYQKIIKGLLYACAYYRDATGKKKGAVRRVFPGEDLEFALDQLDLNLAAQGLFSCRYLRTFRKRTKADFNRIQTKRQERWQVEVYAQARGNARTRKIPFNLTRAEFDQIIEKANGHCMVSGIPFNPRSYKGTNRRPFSPSLDRIDNAKGYSIDNCRLVCQIVNVAMNAWGLEPLQILAEYLVFKNFQSGVDPE